MLCVRKAVPYLVITCFVDKCMGNGPQVTPPVVVDCFPKIKKIRHLIILKRKIVIKMYPKINDRLFLIYYDCKPSTALTQTSKCEKTQPHLYRDCCGCHVRILGDVGSLHSCVSGHEL